MAEPSEAEPPVSESSEVDAGVYVDSSALAKLYVPEVDSDRLESFLHGRTDLMISELAITEVLSAVARRRRDGELQVNQANQIRDALLADAQSGAFKRLDLDPTVHREAERLLFTTDAVALRTLDALHIALAFSGTATHIVTFDHRMAEAATQAGLRIIAV
jgi:predicted nucleic acid-binding protein